MDFLKLAVEVEEKYERKIFCEHPHSTWDNYFIGDQKINYPGRDVFGAKMTCSRDRLPGQVVGRYLHQKNILFW